MRSILLSVALAIGALGLMPAKPAQARPDELVGPSITSGGTIPVAHWGRYGFYRGYYPGFYGGYYPYGGFYRRYSYGGGFYPYGGFGAWPYYGGYYWW
jgi:hypothetical protein